MLCFITHILVKGSLSVIKRYIHLFFVQKKALQKFPPLEVPLAILSDNIVQQQP